MIGKIKTQEDCGCRVARRAPTAYPGLVMSLVREGKAVTGVIEWHPPFTISKFQHFQHDYHPYNYVNRVLRLS
jgi:hypothetical protein